MQPVIRVSSLGGAWIARIADDAYGRTAIYEDMYCTRAPARRATARARGGRSAATVRSYVRSGYVAGNHEAITLL